MDASSNIGKGEADRTMESYPSQLSETQSPQEVYDKIVNTSVLD